MTPTDYGAATAAIIICMTRLAMDTPAAGDRFLVDLAEEMENLSEELDETPAKEALLASALFLRRTEDRPPVS